MKNWNQYSKEHYLFVLSQAEKKLTATIDTMNIIQARGRFQLSIGISIVIGLVGWYVNSIQSEFAYFAILIGCQSLSSILFATLGIYKYRISTAGSTPKDLFHSDFYSAFEIFDDAEKNLIFNECRDYSERIERNNNINKRRLQFVTLSFILLALLPLTTFIFWFFYQG